MSALQKFQRSNGIRPQRSSIISPSIAAWQLQLCPDTSSGRLLQFRFFFFFGSIDFLGFQLIIPAILTACGYQSSAWSSRDEAQCQKGDREGANQSQRWPLFTSAGPESATRFCVPWHLYQTAKAWEVSMLRDFWNVLTTISLHVFPLSPRPTCVTNFILTRCVPQNRKFQPRLGRLAEAAVFTSWCPAVTPKVS